MADGELSRSLSPRLHPDPRHARRARLRFAMGNADEGHRPDGLDDRPPLRDRLRKARPQQASHEIDDGSFCQAQAQRAAVELVLEKRGLAVIVIARSRATKQSTLPCGLWIASLRSQ